MHSVNDDLLGDLDDDNEVLISEISEDSVDLVIEKVWTLIFEICSDEYSEDDSDDDELKFVNERI
jgi:hypothetical protein